MQHTKQVIIDGTPYVLTHLPPTQAFSILTKLLKLAGNTFGDGIDVKDLKQLSEMEINLGSIVERLGSNIDDPEAHKVMMDLLAQITHNGQMLKGPYFEAHFLGKISLMFKLLKEQVEFQYQDFFDAIGGAVGGLLSKVGSTSLNPQAFAGPSGESSSAKPRLSRKLKTTGV